MHHKKYIRLLSLLLIMLLLSGCALPLDQTTQPQLQLGTLPKPTKPSLPYVTAPPETEPTQLTQPTEPPVQELRISTFSHLKEAALDPSLEPGTWIRICDAMEISECVTFCVPVSISVEAALTCSQPLMIQTDLPGTVLIQIPREYDAAAPDIRLDAPGCDVIWETHVPWTSEELAAEWINVKTLNGMDLHEKFGLGGCGQRRILSFSLQTQNNPELSAPLQWSIEGNVLYLPVTYLVSDGVLENAVVTIALDDGTELTENLDLTAQRQLYTLRDDAGRERTYKIITQRITYQLPVFYIEIEDGKEVTSREEYLSATIRIDTSTAAGDFPGMDTTDVLIRGRGHYSWKFDKTPYKLRFEKKTSVLGLEKSKNWVLLANYVDRSLIQNYLAMEMGKVMSNIPYHSNQYPVDVFVNGSYRGVYTFGEQLEAKEERISLEESYTEVDTDYLLELGGTDDGDVYGRDYFHAITLRFVAIKHPDSKRLSQEQLDYLLNYVKAADRAVCGLDGYEDYIDVDSLIDWVILHELTYNLDCCFRRSCYMIKEKGGKLKMGPIWDFDLAFGSFYRYKEGDWATIGEKNGYVQETWMNYLIKDEAFMQRFTARWNEIKQPLLEKALSSVEYMSALVEPSAEMNFEVWDILGKKIPSQSVAHNQYDTYEKMVKRLKTFLQDRYQWLDSELNGGS